MVPCEDHVLYKRVNSTSGALGGVQRPLFGSTAVPISVSERDFAVRALGARFDQILDLGVMISSEARDDRLGMTGVDRSGGANSQRLGAFVRLAGFQDVSLDLGDLKEEV